MLTKHGLSWLDSRLAIGQEPGTWLPAQKLALEESNSARIIHMVALR